MTREHFRLVNEKLGKLMGILPQYPSILRHFRNALNAAKLVLEVELIVELGKGKGRFINYNEAKKLDMVNEIYFALHDLNDEHWDMVHEANRASRK